LSKSGLCQSTSRLLADSGFQVVEDVGAHDIQTRYGLRALNYERMALARNDG
jgi:hypothetical protein